MIQATPIETRLDRYIRARYPLIVLLSHEESRVLAAIDALAKRRNRLVFTWAITRGLQSPQQQAFDAAQTRDLIAALEAILQYDLHRPPTLFVLQDLHGYLNDPVLVRYLRDIAGRFAASYHTLILLSPSLVVPPDLEKTAVVLDWPLPDAAGLESILHTCEVDLPAQIPIELDGARQDVIAAMRGLTEFEAASVLLSAISATSRLSAGVIPYVIQEKAQIIKKSGVLEFYETAVSIAEVGGLPHLKHYAEIKRTAFSKEAAAAGVDAPKGAVLVGVPGTGKSLYSKAIAAWWQMPLLRMDIGALMGGVVGLSESNMRQALKVAEAVAPCILWVDEIEKALGGVESSAHSDGGAVLRMFGSLLTWMQESSAPVYVIATANDIRSLKPELLRRFDDLIFIDLPTQADREQVLAIHLTRRNQNPAAFDLPAVAAAAWGYTGAELEKIVRSAVETAFYERCPLTTAHLLQAVARIIPISQTMPEQIAELRSWAQGRAIFASDPIEPRPDLRPSQSRTVEL